MKIFFVILLVMVGCSGGDWAEKEDTITHAVRFLNNAESIAWVEVEKNNVYIGWDERPDDFGEINRAAAINANIALGSGVHVWSVSGKLENWRPGDGPYFCETSARGGKVKDSSC